MLKHYILLCRHHALDRRPVWLITASDHMGSHLAKLETSVTATHRLYTSSKTRTDWKSAFCSNGVSLAKIFRYTGSSPPCHQPFFVSENWYKRSFIWYKNVSLSFFHFVTIHAFDRFTERPSQYHALHYLLSHGKYSTLAQNLEDIAQLAM